MTIIQNTPAFEQRAEARSGMSSTNPADPTALGAFGFAFATFLGNLVTLGVIHSSDLMVGTAIFLGGVAQLLAGILSYPSRNLFGLTTFGMFGLFWIASGVETLLVATGTINGATVMANFWYLFLWALIVFALFGASFKASRILALTMGFVDLLMLGLAFGTLTGSTVLLKLGACCGLISSVLAVYIGTGTLWNITYGRSILPQGNPTSERKTQKGIGVGA